ncbi:glycosyltransferase [Saccharicrinis fermentans]|uniref:glycosyltransferase n=1 Tax=Saccharicrinis fermentans TaxID=982 RepID=UPI0004B700B7|nr:glycosyltransferase [Saccharicrinis fermentans]
MTISIITATYNAGKTLESAILSVINQTYPHIEFIVVDGKSSDETVDIINQYRPFIHQFVSEPTREYMTLSTKEYKCPLVISLVFCMQMTFLTMTQLLRQW